MRRLVVPFLAAAALVALPAAAGAGSAGFTGVVVGKQHGLLLVSSANGLVRSASGRAAVGARVAISGRRTIVVGRARTAIVRGVVVRRIGSTMLLSSNRLLVAVHTGRKLADAAPTPTSPTAGPQPGDVVSTTVAIANGELNEEQEDEVGHVAAGSIQVQAVVSAVGAGSVTLTVNGQSLTVDLPGGLTLPSSVVGQTVTIQLALTGGGNDQGDDDGGGSSGSTSGSSGASGGSDGGGDHGGDHGGDGGDGGGDG